MSHQIRAALSDLKALAAAVKELEWYIGGGGYRLADVNTEPNGIAVWNLEVGRGTAEESILQSSDGSKAGRKGGTRQRREPGRLVEPGDRVVVETKHQQMVRRAHGGAPSAADDQAQAKAQGVEGVVFRVLTRGPHPHGMKVELRDGTVGRVKQNQTAPGAGEPGGR